jgi:MFS family permease
LPVLPIFVKENLGGGDVAVGLVIAAKTPLAALAQPLFGRVGDRRGRKPLLVGGSITLALSTLGLTWVDSLGVLIAARVVTGLGSAAFIVGAITVVNDIADDARRGELYSLYSLATWGGLTVGPLLGGVLLAVGRWEAVWIVAGCMALAAGLGCLALPETRPSDTPPTTHLSSAESR